MDADLRRRLSAVVGEEALDSDGVVHPANLTQLRELLTLGRAAGLRFLPVGRNDNAPTVVPLAADRLRSLGLDASSLMLRAGAAATWQAVRQQAQGAGLAVASLATVRSDTVGASVAAGEVPHRAVAGVDLLTAAGELISAGGRTLKDVVGYDIGGLVLGSGDQLGMIAAVTLRLEPLGVRTPAEAGPGPWRGDAGIDLAAVFANNRN